MHILKLQAENVKRLTAVAITPDGSPLVVLAGDNESGKSSVLDSIEMLLGGKDHLPPEPIHRGAKAARIVADLGEYIVTRTFTPGGTSLVVANRDGARFPSPQALLDGLLGRLTFDPLAFAEMDEAKQSQLLRILAKIDTTDLDMQRKGAYDQRADANRAVKQAETLFNGMATFPDAGTTLDDFSALRIEMAEQEALKRHEADATAAWTRADAKRAFAARTHTGAEKLVQDLEAQLRAAEQAEELAAAALDVAITEELAAKAALAAARAVVPVSTDIQARMAAVQTKNEQAMANQRHAQAAIDLKALQATAETLDRKVNSLDVQKADLLQHAAFPIDGLGLDDTGVTWQGLPFSQASTSVRIRVSVAIGAALNPKLKVLLIRNGNDLGHTQLGLLAQLAKDAGLQLWVERIAGADAQGQTVIIEDGTVKA